ncbi:hypothetical protein ACH347_33320 [Saccharopolyspora sp. 5N102]
MGNRAPAGRPPRRLDEDTENHAGETADSRHVGDVAGTRRRA